MKTVETVQAPTPGPNSLVISRDVFIKDGHQDGEIHLTPGETFSVSLAQDEAQKRVWDEPPEITNEGVVTKVDYNTASAAEDLKIRCICGRLNLNNTQKKGGENGLIKMTLGGDRVTIGRTFYISFALDI